MIGGPAASAQNAELAHGVIPIFTRKTHMPLPAKGHMPNNCDGRSIVAEAVTIDRNAAPAIGPAITIAAGPAIIAGVISAKAPRNSPSPAAISPAPPIPAVVPLAAMPPTSPPPAVPAVPPIAAVPAASPSSAPPAATVPTAPTAAHAAAPPHHRAAAEPATHAAAKAPTEAASAANGHDGIRRRLICLIEQDPVRLQNGGGCLRRRSDEQCGCPIPAAMRLIPTNLDISFDSST